MASSGISAYFGYGLFAARPVTPLVAANCSAFYFATDTSHLYAWNGTIWKTVL